MGDDSIEVRVEDETVWLTQKLMAELFGVDVRTITEHLKNIFDDHELVKYSVYREFRHADSDGKVYNTKFYNLDAIISVGYRVNSIQATQFRIWATQILRELSIKGFVLDDEYLKKPDQSFDYLHKFRWCIRDGCRTGFLAMQPYAIGGKILL